MSSADPARLVQNDFVRFPGALSLHGLPECSQTAAHVSLKFPMEQILRRKAGLEHHDLAIFGLQGVFVRLPTSASTQTEAKFADSPMIRNIESLPRVCLRPNANINAMRPSTLAAR
jgi:hypothetical protein